ncbi:MAG: hypothetical protein F7C36_02795 [Desulfurococcales archaeon]|nr:hypothetical protein [Desulfurococcales archaeon]
MEGWPRTKTSYKEVVFIFSVSFTVLTLLGMIIDLGLRLFFNTYLSLISILAPSLILASLITVLRRYIARLIIKIATYFMNSVDKTGMKEDNVIDLEDDYEEELFDILDGSEYMYIVWSLISEVAKNVLRKNYDVVIIVTEDGYPIGYYPLDILAMTDGEFEEISLPDNKPVKVIIDEENNRAMIVLNSKSLMELVRAAKIDTEEEGQSIAIKSLSSLRLLYLIAKEIYQAANPSAPNEIVAYISYKALRKLIDGGIIRIEKSLENKLPFESTETRLRILKQVEEEESLLSKNKNSRR